MGILDILILLFLVGAAVFIIGSGNSTEKAFKKKYEKLSSVELQMLQMQWEDDDDKLMAYSLVSQILAERERKRLEERNKSD